MISGESPVDFQKTRQRGHELIGQTIEFKSKRYNPSKGMTVETGEVLSGLVQDWDDTTQMLRVKVDGFPVPLGIKMEQIVEK